MKTKINKFFNHKYGFDVNKANKNMYILLKVKLIVLSNDHKIPSFEQTKC